MRWCREAALSRPRADLPGLTVSAALDILTRAQERMERLEKIGQREGRPQAR